MQVPLLDLRAQYASLKDEIIAEISEICDSQRFILGPKVEKLESEIAAYCRSTGAVGVTSGSDALIISLMVEGIKAGDEVITTPFTFFATVGAIVRVGATPVFADIDPVTFNIDPKKIEEKITSRTKAIIPVHLFGQAADMDPIMEIARKYGLKVLEDCAHATGASYKGRMAGSIGDIGAFSFHSLKNITTCGEGGMITTNHDEYCHGIQNLRCMSNNHSWGEQGSEWSFGDRIHCKKTSPLEYWMPAHFDVIPHNGHWGSNYRMNEIQAAVGCCQLDKLEMLTAKRREIGHKITAGLQGIAGVETVYEPEGYNHVFHLYTVCVDEKVLGGSRDEFMRILYEEEGIQTILHYQPTFHFTGLRRMGYDPNQCPIASEFFYKREMNLPMHPRLTDEDINMMVEGIRNASAKIRKRHCKA